ncbi:hypothetical protein E8E13_000962 [Curvularia kusanoi]|uniref:Uncharacterized protein n=1 Tax=Curvularia kusanoi TaxID=90978 RepID=A0A9P4T939_CURKU|nr:hypothetical protein E8E13_000962 [Curvularia kusanoi]
MATFRTRMSHGKVYPLWTFPPIPAAAESSFGFSVTSALVQTYRSVDNMLSTDTIPLQPAVAESSAGMCNSVVSSGTFPSKLKSQHLARGRSADSHNLMERQDEEEYTFGVKVKMIQVLRVPADGTEPKVEPIAFHSQPPESKHKIPEFGSCLVPDFREFWASYHVDRKFREVSIANQPIKEIEGTYWIYRNCNTDLSENRYIKQILGIDHVDISRRFYYGDIFIVRVKEDPKTFMYTMHNIRRASSQELIMTLKRVFQEEWDNSFLESELQADQYFEGQRLKQEADMEILYQRIQESG